MSIFGDELFTAAEMRAVEKGHDTEQLMERAGAAVAKAVLTRYPAAERIVVVAGGGANGQDGRIAARLLAEAGKDVHVLDAKDDSRELGNLPDVIVDALFGTGFSGEPRPDALALIEMMNNSIADVVSVDLPSGVDASTGEVAVDAVEADHVVTFHGRKLGLEIAPGVFHAPSVEVVDIGLGGPGAKSWPGRSGTPTRTLTTCRASSCRPTSRRPQTRPRRWPGPTS